MLNLLTPNGVCIFSFGGIDAPDAHIDDYMGVDMAYASLGIQGYRDAVKAAGCLIHTVPFDQSGNAHCYMIVQNKR
jgi:hypothetical protein